MDQAPVTPPLVAGPLRLAPFRALRLAGSRISDPASARTLARPYHDVQERLRTWEQRGFLVHDAEPALYLHEYTVSGITVRGLVGAVDVSRRAVRLDQRALLPHEGIYPAQADDLADRMAEMGINPAPILLVQRSPAPLRDLLRTVRAAPAEQLVDRSGQLHRLWTLRDPELLSSVGDLLAPTTALIADGHHRYAAYLKLQARDPGAPTDRGLAMLVDHDDTPLFLGAIHRVLVGSSVRDVADAAAALDIRTRETTQEQAVAALGPSTLVATDNETWLVIDLELADGRVEVEVLHDRLVPSLAHGPSRITYHHAAQDALHQAGPDHGIALLMPAPTLAQVQQVVGAGRLFPEKATSFQPKPAFGVFIRSWHDEQRVPSSPPPPPATPGPPRS
ncbi:DUF1015 family protein [Nocardioides sp.]|uniref:DUF1015 family protein n=1 Tax=Nocardioides sp. TaxID=35761 RepID=UPI002726C865|nr:DUF1015 family protein [Nocardioides sp.]MDO9455022.1 DUF1015 family protein [Nocardioides sp.]